MRRQPTISMRRAGDVPRLGIEQLEPRQLLATDWVVSFLDDFSTDTSADYTSVAPLARPGSVLPTLNVSGGELTLTSGGQTGDVTQAITFHNTATLGVGETVLLDVDLAGGAFGAGNEMLGLTVSAGIMTGVDPIPPATDMDLRDDEFSFVFGGFRSSGTDDFRSDGFIAVDLGEVLGGEQIADQSTSLANIISLFVTRTADQDYDLGWVDASDSLHTVRTVNIDLGASPSVGIFTDYRTASFSQTVDNLRIAHEATADPYPENPVRFARQVENLDRGVVAVRSSSSQVYIGWRLLGTDAQDIAFNLYRYGGGGGGGPLAPIAEGVAAASVPGIKLNGAPLTQTTDYVDTPSSFTGEITYYVVPVIDGVEQVDFGAYTLEANAPVQQHLDIPIMKPADGVTPAGEVFHYGPTASGSQGLSDASVGDLGGDGQYEVIVKWEPSNKSDNSWEESYTGNTYIDAYSITPDEFGNHLLWRIDLGINVRSGQHMTQFLVYDFDGDGRSEVVLKTGDGTIDGQGNAIGDPLADWREPLGSNYEGYVRSGPEYLTVFDGLTGAEITTIDFPLERGTIDSWGDNYGNRSERYMAAVAYLDGVHPSIVWTRGIYGPAAGYTARNEQVALDFHDGQLTQRWRFNAVSGGQNSEFVGEGGQSLSIADVDGDGFDEIVYGAAVVDHDGTLLYATGLGHGDALHVSDMVPSNPGLEIFMPHESASTNGNVAASLRDAMTGEIILAIPGSGDVGRGVAADVDPNSPGYEVWAVNNQILYSPEGVELGTMPYDSRGKLYNFAIWWDADLTRELLNEDSIYKYDNPGSHAILNAWQDGAAQSVQGKYTPALQADLFGDWREEVIWRNEQNTEIQIWTTTTPAINRLFTLMHDTQYREAVAWQNVGYNQPPHPSFFLGEGMEAPPTPLLYLAGGLTGDYNRDDVVDAADYAVWRSALTTQDLTADGDHNGVVDQADYNVWRANYGAVASAVAAAPAALSPSAQSAIAEASLLAAATQTSSLTPSVSQLAWTALAADPTSSSDEPDQALVLETAISTPDPSEDLLLAARPAGFSRLSNSPIEAPLVTEESLSDAAKDQAFEEVLLDQWARN